MTVTFDRRYGYWLLVLIALANTGHSAESVIVAIAKDGQIPKQPQVAVADDDVVHLVYGIGDSVFHCRSTDKASSFGVPKEAFQAKNLSLGKRRGPRVAIVGKNLVVTAIAGPKGKGRDGDLQTWYSTDQGATWVGPIPVNDVRDSAREGLHGMASGPDGSIWCVWLDQRDNRMEVYASKSTDGGVTWYRNIRVFRAPHGNVCECCHPSVVIAESGVHVMFRNSLAGNRDMYLATSHDGKEFGAAVKLGRGFWKLDKCPMDGGMISVDSNGSVVTVWRRNADVYLEGNGAGPERSLGQGQQPWIAPSKSGPVMIWTSGREGDLLVSTSEMKQPKRLDESARDPMMASGIRGDGPIIACWESKRDTQAVVMAARIDPDELRSP